MILTGVILKFLEKNLFLCHFIYHKSHMDYAGVDPRPAASILKFLEKNLFLCHFIYHKSHMDYAGVDPRPAASKASHRVHEP